MKKTRTILIAVCIVAIAAAAAWIFFSAGREVSTAEIHSGTVGTGNISRPTYSVATLQVKENNPVVSPCGVVVTKLLITNGSEIREGDPIAEVDVSSVENTLKKLYDEKFALEYNIQHTLNGEYTVDEDGKVHVGAFTLDEYQLGQYAQCVSWKEYRKKIEEMIIELQKAAATGKWLSTEDGVVSEMYQEVIECSKDWKYENVLLQNGSINLFEICKVARTDSMQLVATVDERDITNIAEGDAVTMDVPAISVKGVEGRVVKISQTGYNNGGMAKFSVFIDVEADERLIPGMTVVVKMVSDIREDVPVLPLEAIHTVGSRDYVYTGYDSKTNTLTNPVEVEFGVSDGNNVEIISGLGVGDMYYF